MALTLGTRLGPYDISESIGAGGAESFSRESSSVPTGKAAPAVPDTTSRRCTPPKVSAETIPRRTGPVLPLRNRQLLPCTRNLRDPICRSY
jgi:hypothetical protein